MADIRNLNSFTLGAGFNITSGEPIDSRQCVNSIEQIYLPENWTNNVKPYNGLQVISADGQIRICIDADNYQLEASWIDPAGGSVTIDKFTVGEDGKIAEAKKVGQFIYVTAGDETYPAAPYVVTAVGSVSKLSEAPATGDIAGEVATLTREVESIQIKLATVAEGAQINVIESVKVDGEALPVEDKAVNIDLASKLAIYAKQVDLESLAEEVGNPKTDEDAATGIYKLIADTVDALNSKISEIPKFNIEVVSELPSENISNTTVYLVPDKESAGDLYTEYIYVNGQWENLGKQTVDLSGYSTTEQMNLAISTALADYVTSETFEQYKIDLASELAETYEQKGAADAVSQELTPRIDGIAALVGGEELPEGEENLVSRISGVKSVVDELKVKNVDNTSSSGVALELSEGIVKVTVNKDTLTSDLVGQAGQIGVLSGSTVKIGQDIKATVIDDQGNESEETIITSTVSVAEAIRTLAGQIQAAVAGGITGISGDEYIKVEGSTTAKSLTLEISKVTEAVSNEIISDKSAIRKNNEGKLELYWSEI